MRKFKVFAKFKEQNAKIQPLIAKANKNTEFVKRKEQNAKFVSFHCQTQMAKAEFKGFVVKIQTTKHEKSKLTRFILP